MTKRKDVGSWFLYIYLLDLQALVWIRQRNSYIERILTIEMTTRSYTIAQFPVLPEFFLPIHRFLKNGPCMIWSKEFTLLLNGSGTIGILLEEIRLDAAEYWGVKPESSPGESRGESDLEISPDDFPGGRKWKHFYYPLILEGARRLKRTNV